MLRGKHTCGNGFLDLISKPQAAEEKDEACLTKHEILSAPNGTVRTGKEGPV